MLAKLWKKVLLAVCIIACLFNIVSKIVNRHSLEVNLESVNDGSVVFNLSKDEEKQQVDSNVIEGVVNNEQSTQNVVEQPSVTTEGTTVQNTTVENTVVEGAVTEQAPVENTTQEGAQNESGDRTVKYSEGLFDKVLDFMGLQRK